MQRDEASRTPGQARGHPGAPGPPSGLCPSPSCSFPLSIVHLSIPAPRAFHPQHPFASDCQPCTGGCGHPQSAGKRDIFHQFSRNEWKKGKCLDTHCHQVAEEDPDLTLVPCGIILSEFHILPQENPLFFTVINGLTPGFGMQSKALP